MVWGGNKAFCFKPPRSFAIKRFIDKESCIHASLRKNFANFTQSGKGDAMRNLKSSFFHAAALALIAFISINHLAAKQSIKSNGFFRSLINKKKFDPQKKRSNRKQSQHLGTEEKEQLAPALGFFKKAPAREQTAVQIVVVDDALYNDPNSELGDIKNGFTIQENMIVDWAVSSPDTQKVNGPIVWTSNFSTLKLSNNLKLGAQGSIIGGFSQVDQQNSIKLDGQGNTLYLENNLTIEDLNFTTRIGIISDIIIDGQGTLVTLNNFDTFFSTNQSPHKVTFKNMTFSFTEGKEYWSIFTDNNYILDNVVVLCPHDGNLLWSESMPSSLTLRNKVSFGSENQRIALVGAGSDKTQTIVIDAGAECRINSGVHFQTGDSSLGYADIIMTDQTSTIIFDNCNFYTGALGSIIIGGTIKYANYMQIFNGDYTTPFVANTEKSNAYITYATEEYVPGSMVHVYGIKLEANLAITDKNARLYKNGFTIPANSVYVWDSSVQVTGAIQFTNNTSMLVLNQNLGLSETGSLFDVNGNIPNNGQLKSPHAWQVTQTINDLNSPKYQKTFTVPENARYTWNSTVTIEGIVQSAATNGVLALAQDLHLGENGSLLIGNNENIELNGNTVTKTITDDSAGNYTAGFTIPEYMTLVWATQNPAAFSINGPITWGADSSILKLATDLYLGEKGHLIGAFSEGSWGSIEHLARIDGQGNKILFSADASLPGMALLSDLTLDGVDSTIALTMNNSYGIPDSAAFWGQFAAQAPVCRLQNFTLNLNADGEVGSYLFPFYGLSQVILDNIVLNPNFFNGCGSRYSLSNELDKGFFITKNVVIAQKDSPCGFEFGNSYYDFTAPLTIDAQAVVLLEASKVSQISAITMQDPTSSLILKDTALYSGANGLSLKNGNLYYQNSVHLYNGTYQYALDDVFSDGTFVANTDPAKGFRFDGTTQDTLDNSLVTVHGYVTTNTETTLGIDDGNAAAYTQNLIIPAHTTCIWNSSAIMQGNVSFADATSKLELTHDFVVNSHGSLFTQDGIIPNNGKLILNDSKVVQSITEYNYPIYQDGFTIPSGTIISWDVVNPKKQPLNGTIRWTDETSLLRLTTDLYLGKQAVLQGGMISDWEINAAFIDAAKNTIFLSDNTLLRGESSINPVGLFTHSNLKIDGKNNKLTCPNLFNIGSLEAPCSIDFRNINLEFSSPINIPMLWGNNYLFENLNLSCPGSGKILGEGSSLFIKGVVGIGEVGQYITLIDAPYSDVPVLFGTNAILSINPAVNFELIKSTENNAVDFMMNEQSSLLLNGCNFYTGANGLRFSQGSIIYQNNVGLFNGNYSNPFRPNTDPTKALMILNTAKEEYKPGATVQVSGLKQNLRVVNIVDANASYFERGFTIPANTIYIWDTAYKVDGPILFSDKTSYLQLEQNLLIGDKGSLFTIDGTIPRNGTILNKDLHQITQIIGPNNSAKYIDGFIIPENCVYSWADPNPEKVIEGSISWGNNTSILQLKSDLHLGAYASFNAGYLSVINENCFWIDGQDKTLFLNNNMILMGSDESIPTSLFLLSNLTIEGHGYSFACPKFDSICSWNQNNSLTLKNMHFIFEEWYPDEWALCLSTNLILDNVTVLCPRGGNLLGSDSSLELRNNVTFGSAGQRISLIGYGSNIPVFVDSGAILHVNKGVIFEAANSTKGSILLELANQSATILLNACQFYTGAEGLSLTTGTIHYNGAVTLVNGDLNGAINTNPKYAFKIYESVAEEYSPQAKVTVQGLKETIELTTITDENIASYQYGFSIPQDTTFIWDATTPISGAIQFTDSTSTLVLKQPLTLTGQGSLFGLDGSIPNDGTIIFNDGEAITQIVDHNNFAQYKAGFTIGGGCNIAWQVEDPAANMLEGSIRWADYSSLLTLHSDLYLTKQATLEGFHHLYGGLSFAIIDGQGARIIFTQPTTLATDLLFLLSDLTLNGQGNKISWPKLLALIGIKDEVSVKCSLENMYLEFTTIFDEPILWQGNYCLDNVTLDCLEGFALLGEGSSLTIQNNVSLETASKPIWLVTSGHKDQPVIIAENSELAIKRGGTLIVGDSIRGSALLRPIDQSARIKLNNCDFYTGQEGIKLETGTLIYENKVQIFNGDYTETLASFKPNTNTDNAFILYEDVVEQVAPGAKVTVLGLKIDAQTIIITDENFSTYQKGFTIPTQSIAVLESSQAFQGPITFTDQTSYLSLSADLVLGEKGSLFNKEGLIPNNGVLEYNGYSVTQIIDDCNIKQYLKGFVIPVNTTFIWNANQIYPVRESITWSNETSKLVLNNNLYVSSKEPFKNCGGTCTIISQDATLFIQENCVFKQPINILDGAITINSNNKTMTVSTAPWLELSTEDTVTLENTIISLEGATHNIITPAIFNGCGGDLIIQDSAIVLADPLQEVALVNNFNAIHIKNDTTFAGAGMELNFAGAEGKNRLFIEQNSNLTLYANLVFIAANSSINEADIQFADRTAHLILSGCDFYTGALGLTLKTGTIEYKGTVQYFNGDYAEPFIPNTDPAHALIFDSTLTEVYSEDAAVQIFGTTLATTTITDDGIDAYVNGFTINANATVSWNAQTTVEGPIIFADETVTLILESDLSLGSEGELVLNGGTLELNGYNIIKTIDTTNAELAHGFTIPAHTTVVWDGKETIRGPIRFTDETSTLRLKQPLHLDETGSLFDNDGSIPNNGKIVFGDNLITQEIGRANLPFYQNGFTIPEQTKVVWNVPGAQVFPIRGNIYWANQFSSLALVEDIYISSSCTFVGGVTPWHENLITIEGNGKTIYFEHELTLAGINQKMPTLLFALEGCSFDGRGGTLNCPNFDTVVGFDDTCLFKNLTLKYNTDRKVFPTWWPLLTHGNYILDNVAIAVPQGGSLMGQNSSLTIENEFIAGQQKEQLCLVAAPGEAPIHIKMAPLSRMVIQPETICIAGDSELGTPAFAMVDPTASIKFNHCKFYTGANGLLLVNGVLEYAGMVQIFNGDFDMPFEANENPEKAFLVSPSVIENFEQGASLQVFGLKSSPITITNANISKFSKGFVIPANSAYVWNCDSIMHGAIQFTDATSTLILENDLKLSGLGSLFMPDGTIPNNGNLNNLDGYHIEQLIDRNNINFYTNGFVIPEYATMEWNAPSCNYTVNGPITWINDTSHLKLMSDLHLGAEAILNPIQSVVTIDGQGKALVLGGDITLTGDAEFGGWLIHESDLTIDGDGHQLSLSSFNSIRSFDEKSPNLVTFKNMGLEFEEVVPSEWALFFNGNYLFDKVAISCPNGGNILGAGSTLTIRNEVSLGEYGQRIALACYDFNIPVTIESDATLVINPEVSLQVGDSYLGAAKINLESPTARLLLDSATLYSGTIPGGMTLSRGVIEYHGDTTLFNGNLLAYNEQTGIFYEDPTVNTDPAKAIVLDDSITQLKANNAQVTYEGIVQQEVELEINNYNFEDYQQGFTVAPHTLYRWNVTDETFLVNGPIKFADSSAKLLLDQDLGISQFGQIFNPQTGLINVAGQYTTAEKNIKTNGHRIIQTVKNENQRFYKAGFAIPKDTTILWAVTKTLQQPGSVTGDITYHDQTALLLLKEDLSLSQARLSTRDANGQCNIDSIGGVLNILEDSQLQAPLRTKSPLTIKGNKKHLSCYHIPAFESSATELTISDLKIDIIYTMHQMTAPALFIGSTREATALALNNVNIFAQDGLGHNFGFHNCTVEISGNTKIKGVGDIFLWSGESKLVIKPAATLTLGIAGFDTQGVSSVTYDMGLYRSNNQQDKLSINIDPTATLILDGGDLHLRSGAEGLRFTQGNIIYDGCITLENASPDGEINEEYAKAILFDAAVVQSKKLDTQVKVNGFAISIIDDSNFARMAASGFFIPEDMTYQWNCSESCIVNGTIRAANKAVLVLNKDLFLGQNGRPILAKNALATLGDYALKNIINNANAGSYKDGFKIPTNTTYVWQSDARINGPITFDQGAKLVLNQDLHFGNQGTIDLTASGLIANGFRVFNAENKAILIGINDNNYRTYDKDFYIPDNTIFEWGCSSTCTIRGTLTFGRSNAILKLAQDLYLDEGCRITGEGENCPILGQQKAVVLNGNMPITVPLAIKSGITINGNSNRISAYCSPLLKAQTNDTIVIQDTTLLLDGETSAITHSPYLFHGFANNSRKGGDLIFDNVTMTAKSSFKETYLCGKWKNVFFRNQNNINGTGKTIQLGYSQSMLIEAASMLKIEPTTTVIIDGAQKPEGLSAFDKTSVLYLDSCVCHFDTFDGGHSPYMPYGTIVIDHEVLFDPWVVFDENLTQLFILYGGKITQA